MYKVAPIGGFYQRLEAYKTSLQKNRPATMTDNQFNEQIGRYAEGLQHDEFKLNNRIKGQEFGKNLALEQNGQAKLMEAAEMLEFEKEIQREQKWLEASRQPKAPQGRPVDKHTASAVMERQKGSERKGILRQESHIKAQEMRADGGNASELKRAKIKKKAIRQQQRINNQKEKMTPQYIAYQDKVTERKIKRRVRNTPTANLVPEIPVKPAKPAKRVAYSARQEVKQVVQEAALSSSSSSTSSSVKNTFTLGKIGIITAIGAGLGLAGIFISKYYKNAEQNNQKMSA